MFLKNYCIFSLLALLILCTTNAGAQNLPEQNCPGGIPVCQISYTQTTSYSGHGTINELTNGANAGCLANSTINQYDEVNSVWYIITVVSPGYLAFNLTPNPVNNDYDWALWDITANGCSSIYNYTTNTPQNYLPVRCNASGNLGVTGMSPTACCPSQGPNNTPIFSSTLAVTPGQVFALEINDWSNNVNGYTLDFSPSTASIFDTVRPHFDSIGNYCGTTDSISFTMSEAVLCSSIASNGSDYYITPNTATPIATQGLTCIGAGTSSSSIGVKFSNALPPGNYVLHVQNGTDGNTTIDNCTNQQLTTDSLKFSVFAPPQLSVGPDTLCGDSLQIFCNVLNQTPGINYSYQWSPNQYISDPNIQNPKVDPPGNMTYTVTVTQNGSSYCSATTTLSLVVYHATITSINNNTPICSGDTVYLSCTGTGTSYNWTGPDGFTSNLQNPIIPNAQALASGVYSVTATYLVCTSPPTTTTVVVNQTPYITGYTDTNPSVCHGADGTITLDGLTANTPFTVYYTMNGTTQTPQNIGADNQGDVTVTGLSAGSYSLYVTQNNCTSNTIDSVVLVDPPIPGVSITENTPVCPGATVTFSVTTNVTGSSFAWTGPNGFTSNLQSNVINDFTLVDSGLYMVTVEASGCIGTDSALLYSYPYFRLYDITPGQTIKYGDSVQLNADGAVYYLWTPDNGTLSNPNINYPVARPLDPTVYVVHGIDTHGCSDTATVSIDIDYTMTEFIPSAFSPNGDGRNDVFRILNMKYQKLLDFRIYNRWGQMVFHTTDVNQGWDGTCNGVPQDMGVYNYDIIVARPDGTEKNYTGTVTLVR